MALARVFSPESESEVLVAAALLEAHGIPVFVHNRGIGSILPGVQINAYNTQSIMVPEEFVAEAVDLLARLDGEETVSAAESMSLRDKVRIVLEGLLLGWFVPGSRSRLTDRDDQDARHLTER